jgi:hypothetical protein
VNRWKRTAQRLFNNIDRKAFPCFLGIYVCAAAVLFS